MRKRQPIQSKVDCFASLEGLAETETHNFKLKIDLRQYAPELLTRTVLQKTPKQFVS
jgi:hypothetical protein